MTYANVAAGAPIYASTINDLIKYGPARPICQLEQQAGQTLTSAASTELTFGASSEVFDDDNWHSTTVNTSRVTPTTAGRYKVTARGVIAFNTAVLAVNTYIMKNGAVIARQGNHKPNSGSNTALECPELVTFVDMNGSSDYVEMGLQQTSTAAASQTTNASSSGRSTLIVELVRAA